MLVVLFDIDGTLLATGGAGKTAMEKSLVEEFHLPCVRSRVSYSGRTDRAIGLDLLRSHDQEPSPENWERLVRGYLRRLPQCLAAHQGKVLPGIRQLLEHLAQHEEAAVGLLTGNVREGARLKLSHYEIFDFFEFGGFGDHHLDRCDVAREAHAEVERHLNGRVDPQGIWIIGDTPLDVQCARAIGARVAAIGTGWHSLEELRASQPDVLLSDLSDPEPLFQAWNR